MSPEEADILAGEYVLGTLDPLEREAFSRALARDPALQSVVTAWERRFAPLATAAKPVVPSDAVWSGIERALPPASVADAARERAGPEGPAIPELDRLRRIAEETRRMRRALTRWRVATAGLGLIAAGLAVALAFPRLVPSKPHDAYVAVVNQGGNQPALVVRVDLATNSVSVRPVNMETPAGRSLELWVIGQGQAPRSLGLVGTQPLTLQAPAVFAGGTQPQATSFAVSSEPPGGSTTGSPTGPIVYSGTLVKE
jgi:anti-sigma-K factor RskA